MAVDYPTVQRLINFGGSIRESAQGGSGIEYYWVLGLAREEVALAHTLGLPKIGSFHPDSRLKFLGTVQNVEVFREMGPVSFIVRVVFSVGGTFNFSTRIGSRFQGGFEKVVLPVMGKKGSNTYYSINPPVIWDRVIWSRVETSKYFGVVDDAIDILTRNLGLFYAKRSGHWINTGLPGSESAGPIYRLTGANITTDQGNNTRIDTYFSYKASLPAFPASGASPFSGQSVDIPALPPDGFYSSSADGGTITAHDPLAILPEGEVLPWLP